MVCYNPISATLLCQPDGSRKVVFASIFKVATNGEPIQVPCGKCDGCKLEYSRVWAVRCTHEASLFKNNCFLTLTYDDRHCPPNKSLVKADFQKFMKRLRKRFKGIEPVKRFNRSTGSDENLFPIRYYMCGEYGEQNFRPHYHALIFNYDFSDKIPQSKSGDYMLYKSEILSELWPYGFSSIGTVNFQTAGYVARYALKGAGSFLKRHWAASLKCCDIDTHELKSVCIPQYTDMSRAWGIGSGWYEKYGYSDVYAHDSLIVNSVETRPPRYYDSLYAKECGDDALAEIKLDRVLTAEKFLDNNTPERLAVRLTCKRDRVKQLKRRLGYDA